VVGYILRWFTCPVIATDPGINVAMHARATTSIGCNFDLKPRDHLNEQFKRGRIG